MEIKLPVEKLFELFRDLIANSGLKAVVTIIYLSLTSLLLAYDKADYKSIVVMGIVVVIFLFVRLTQDLKRIKHDKRCCEKECCKEVGAG